MGRKILLALDGSPHSQRALRWYAANMNCEEDSLLFVYIAEPAHVGYGAGATSQELYEKNVGQAVQRAKDLAADVKKLCDELGVKGRTRFLEKFMHGPGPALVSVANEESVDLIVMGNRGLGTLRRTFMGSVSDYVLHHAHRATVIVPPPKKSGGSASSGSEDSGSHKKS